MKPAAKPLHKVKPPLAPDFFRYYFFISNASSFFISPARGDFIEKSTPQRAFFMADRVGFEPTSLLRDYLISSVVLQKDFSGK